MAEKKVVGVLFGSRSVEHEVSIVTAQQIMDSLDPHKYSVVPIFISKSGEWYTGEALRDVQAFNDLPTLLSHCQRAYLAPDTYLNKQLVEASASQSEDSNWLGKVFKPARNSVNLRHKLDVIIPALHGTMGEDGTVQGLLELAGLPYVGAGVVGSAVGMDKIIMKAAFRAYNLPIVKYITCTRRELKDKPEQVFQSAEENLSYPMFVKPANLGSSIGISKASTREELKLALEVASHYDRRLLIEESVEGAIEINCSVIGNDTPIASVCEQPISWESFLSYEDKYMRGGKNDSGTKGMASLQRRIPAPISDDLTKKIQEMAIKAFLAVDCRGIARIDFLVKTDTQSPIVNEINTLPGSFSFYLWEPTGISFSQLLDKLIEYAFETYEEKKKQMYSYDSKLLNKLGLGAKGGSKVPTTA